MQGYDVENPNITLLKLRNFTIGRKLKDEEVLGEGGLGRVADLLGVLVPFVRTEAVLARCFTLALLFPLPISDD